MGDPRDIGTMYHFSQSVHADGSTDGFPELLRNVAATVEGLGDVQVSDMTFHHETDPAHEFLTITVYYDRPHERPDLRVLPGGAAPDAG